MVAQSDNETKSPLNRKEYDSSVKKPAAIAYQNDLGGQKSRKSAELKKKTMRRPLPSAIAGFSMASHNNSGVAISTGSRRNLKNLVNPVPEPSGVVDSL